MTTKLSRRTFSLLPAAAALAAQAPPAAPKKRLLVIGLSKGFQHDSVSHGMATLWRLGQDTGLWETYLRTDSQLLTKKKPQGNNMKNLDYFDAVSFFTTGELDLDESQKADLMSFIKVEGKGFLGLHTATDTYYKWPEYGEMVGGWFDQHPWNTFQAPVINEDPSHPITRHLPASFTVYDEIYQLKDWSREKVRVLLRLDETKIDLKRRGVHRQDGDFAVAYLKTHGKGRVFYSTLGHTIESWDRPDIQKMWLEAAKWCLGLMECDATPRPRPAQG